MSQKHQQETAPKQSISDKLPLWLEVQPAIRAQLRSPLVNAERVTLTLEAKLSFQPLYKSIAKLLATRMKAFGQHTADQAKAELKRFCEQLPQHSQLSHQITQNFICELTGEESTADEQFVSKELEDLLHKSIQIDLGFYIKDKKSGPGNRYFIVAPSTNLNLNLFIQRLGAQIQTKIAAYQSTGEVLQSQSFILKEAEGIFKQAKENQIFCDQLTEGLGLSLEVKPRKEAATGAEAVQNAGPKKGPDSAAKQPELDLQEMAKTLTLQKTDLHEL